jgi:TDG/mug DNA glycosylase family protein
VRRRSARPAYVAFLGISTYRVAFDRPRAVVGRQPESFEELCRRRPGPTGVWVLPNPSGLNAHYQQAALTAAYAQLHEAIKDR